MTVKSKASHTSWLGPIGAKLVTCSRLSLPSHEGDQEICSLFVAKMLPFAIAIEQHVQPGVAQTAHGRQVPEALVAEPPVRTVVQVVVREPPLALTNDAYRLPAGRLPVLGEPAPSSLVPGCRRHVTAVVTAYGRPFRAPLEAGAGLTHGPLPPLVTPLR